MTAVDDDTLVLAEAAEAFRKAMLESGALNHVKQDTYFSQLRALETAIAATQRLRKSPDSGLRQWVNKYPGDPEARTDALVLEIERLEGRATEDIAEIAKLLEENKRLRTALRFIADREDYTFAECSVAEAIVDAAKSALSSG